MKKLLLSVLFILIASAAQTVYSQELEGNCVVSAKITDRDPNGLNVRSKPNINGKIIRNLKHNNDEKFIVYVVGYSNGWVRIGGANDGKIDVSKAEGWVSAKMLSVIAGKGAKLYQNPDSNGKLIAAIPSGTILQIAGFKCLNIKVAYQGKIGWLSSMER